MLHLIKYRIRTMLRERPIVFWTLVFPILLGTLFKASFGQFISEDISYEIVPVAVVINGTTSAENKQFIATLDQLSKKGDNQLFETKKVSATKAFELLKDKKVDGIITVDKTKRSLNVANSLVNQSILKSFLEQFEHKSAMITEIASTHPEKVATLLLENDQSSLKEINLSGSKFNTFTEYFLALIGMAIMFGSIFGMKCAMDVQADLSSLGMRLNITPTHKLKLIISNTISGVLLLFSEIVLVTLYIQFVLDIAIITQPVLFYLIILCGCLIAIALGQFVTILIRKNESFTISILTAISMLFSFLSGLMVANMQDMIERSFPLLNKINPNALMTDAFYCLNVFNDYTRYIEDLLILIAIAVLLTVLTYIKTRREKYASL